MTSAMPPLTKFLPDSLDRCTNAQPRKLQSRVRQAGNLAAELEGTYGVGSLAAPTEAVIWAADRVADRLGNDVAKRELSALNRRREKAGRPLAHLPFGHRLF